MKTLVPIVFLLLLFTGIDSCRNPRMLHSFGKEETLPLRGLLALLVVIGHLDIATGYCSCFLHFLHWSTPAVAVFFFLSGYGYAVNSERMKTERPLAFVTRTVCKLFLPLVLSAFIYCAYLTLAGNFDAVRILSGSVRGETYFLPHSWYVFALLVLSLCFYSGAFTRYGLLLSFGTAFALYIMFRWVFEWPFCWWWNLFSFPVGVAYATFEPRVRMMIGNSPFTFYASTAFAFVFCLMVSRLFPAYTPFISEFPYLLLGPISVLLMYRWSIVGLRWIGVVSFEVYLIHGVFEHGFSGLKTCSWLGYTLAVMGATLLSAIVAHKVNAPLMRILLKK